MIAVLAEALLGAGRWPGRRERAVTLIAVVMSAWCGGVAVALATQRAAARRRGRSANARSPRVTYPCAVHCPMCQADDTKVVDSRLASEGAAVRRRRRCPSCGHRFTTFERVDEVPLTVVKSNGTTEPFDRAKIVKGVEAATKVTGDQCCPDRPHRRVRRGLRPARRFGDDERQHRAPRARSARRRRRGRLPAFCQRLQELRRRHRLPPRDRVARQAQSGRTQRVNR